MKDNIFMIFFKKITMLTTSMVVSFSLLSQSVIPIDIDLKPLYKITSSVGYGNLLPIDGEKSLVNISEARLVIVDNNTGKIIKEFDYSQLKSKASNFLIKHYQNTFEILSQEEINLLPYCQLQEFVFGRFYRIDDKKTFAQEIIFSVKNKLTRDNELIKLVAFFDNKLELLDIKEREIQFKHTIYPNESGFFLGLNDYFIKKTVPGKNEKSDYLHFQLKDYYYKYMGEFDLINSANLPNQFPGRYFTVFKINDEFYVNNGTELFRTFDIFDVRKSKIDMKLNDNEIITVLNKLNETSMFGVSIEVDHIGVATFATVFKTDLNFNKIDKLTIYDQRNIRFLSAEVIDDTIILLLYDKNKDVYLIEKKKI